MTKTLQFVAFTQYSDTANYIHHQLKKRGIQHIDKATGGSKNPTAIVERFSPLSNQADVSAENELRVLIATDVLSEGQNLQDAHVIVNYDLPGPSSALFSVPDVSTVSTKVLSKSIAIRSSLPTR